MEPAGVWSSSDEEDEGEPRSRPEVRLDGFLEEGAGSSAEEGVVVEVVPLVFDRDRPRSRTLSFVGSGDRINVIRLYIVDNGYFIPFSSSAKLMASKHKTKMATRANRSFGKFMGLLGQDVSSSF